jgi:hypothetical protein
LGCDAVPMIVPLGSQQFDIAVSEAARHRLIATADSFQILQTRLTEDDPLIVKFGALHAFSRMLARYMQIVPGEQVEAWHAGSIRTLRDKVTQSIDSAFLQNGFREDLRSTIACSRRSQDIYVGLLYFFVGHSHIIHLSQAARPALFLRVEKDYQAIKLYFDITGSGPIHFKVFWNNAFELEEHGIYLYTDIPSVASIFRVLGPNVILDNDPSLQSKVTISSTNLLQPPSIASSPSTTCSQEPHQEYWKLKRFHLPTNYSGSTMERP